MHQTIFAFQLTSQHNIFITHSTAQHFTKIDNTAKYDHCKSSVCYNVSMTCITFCSFPSMACTTLIAIVTTLLVISFKVDCSSSDTWIKGGYWNSGTGFPVSEIDSTLFTHLTCSFAFVNSSSYQILINSSDQQSFYTFNDTVKLKNPSIVTLLSIQVGREHSPIFSSMISQSSYRKSFIESSITISRLHGFQGLELYGVMPNNNTNMTNLGTLLNEWRDAIGSEARSSGNSQLVLVMAGFHFPEKEFVSYPIESLRKNLDWIHVIAYDYYVPTKYNYTGYHAALYGPSRRASANDSIMEWIRRGISANKLVLGLPLHGYGWVLVDPQDNDVGAPASGPATTRDGLMGYKYIKSQTRDYGYGAVSVYNSTYVVNVIKSRNFWVNYDDVEAIRAKISYAKETRLLGYNVFQLSDDDNWEVSRAAGGEGDADHKRSGRLGVIVAAVVVIAILLMGIIIFCYWQRLVLKSKCITDALKRSMFILKAKLSGAEYHGKNSSSPQAFSFAIIKAATNNFSSENKLGEGGFGPVYKGRLPSGQEIAVKRLSKTSSQGLEEFKNEVTLTAGLQHVNLVRVLGFCTENDEKMLVYNCMPNKSLDAYLFDPNRRYQLDWRKRVHIIEGVTQGLLYLQEYSNFTISHRDIKASNILLDNEMNPKISDFGMARLFRKDVLEANTGRIVGTYGYVPPEYVRKGIYSMKYDVYSFGVLLLQVISGKKNACFYGQYENLNLLEYAYDLWKDGAVMEFIDPALDDSNSTCKLIRCMQVALLCVQENPADRPSMLEVSSMLKNETPAAATPKRPSFSIKSDEDEACKPRLKERILSANDMTISQDVPRRLEETQRCYIETAVASHTHTLTDSLCLSLILRSKSREQQSHDSFSQANSVSLRRPLLSWSIPIGLHRLWVLVDLWIRAELARAGSTMTCQIVNVYKIDCAYLNGLHILAREYPKSISVHVVAASDDDKSVAILYLFSLGKATLSMSNLLSSCANIFLNTSKTITTTIIFEIVTNVSFFLPLEIVLHVLERGREIEVANEDRDESLDCVVILFILLKDLCFRACMELNVSMTYITFCSFPSMACTTLIAIVTTLLFISFKVDCSSSDTWIKGGYWYCGTGFPVSEIDSTLFTHLTCSFAFVNSSSYQILINSSDQQSFYTFTDTVQLKNPSIVTLLSIWVGREHSPIFSSMISQSSYRKSFIESSITISRLYGFKGLELRGVMPNNSTNMTNLGTLFNEWRNAIASEARSSGNSQLVLAMAGYHFLEKEFISYPIESMRKNLDWIHVIAYDYYVPTKYNYTGYHAALYGPSRRASANDSIMEWISRGISGNKLVLGLPLHGYGWSLLNPQDKDVGAPASGPALTLDGSMGYKLIKSQIRNYGYGVVSGFNSTYVVNFIKLRNNWINFDDVEAIRAKIGYAKEKRLLGYNFFQLDNDENWELSRAAGDEGDADHKRRGRLRGIVAAVVVIAIFLMGIIICCYLQRRVLQSKGITDALKRSMSILKAKLSAAEYHGKNSSSPQAFSFAIIKAATNNFSSENKLGEGGFGPVYKGRLPSGQEIAVKRLSKTSTQGLEEFKNEVTLTAGLQHVNLVRVLGFCTENDEKMLVYKCMPNKSLDAYLFDPNRRYQLDWRMRVHIIDGVTQGLLYLQEYSNFTIIHRDIKASNILLDNEMNPKISDFGMARLFRKDELEANTDRIVGTYGYVPPEYVRKGIYSMKYDVYSFGVLLMQIISGKRNTCSYGPYENLNLLEYAYDLWKDGTAMEFIDPALDDSNSTCKLIRCLEVALLCVQENPADRPSMLKVSSMLKNETPAAATPKRPSFSIKNDDDEECKPRLKERIWSVNDMTISQDVPR
ncbi:uncharacterized protein LOC119997019 [Tripterygium wilfordii]|uniref:uncharacterized protein LOC119997019 n=1 Tax=Tripterygium wilfordii TaxID=458696 RepID=UPI0018F83F11|nr:uncharacterized protein LOC119997019 [Tripterygium wilfordii]